MAVSEAVMAGGLSRQCQMTAWRRPGLALLLAWTTADGADLRAARGAKPDADAIRRIDALDQSAAIYRLNSSAPSESNRRRSLLMKRQFMQHWDATPPPRRAAP